MTNQSNQLTCLARNQFNPDNCFDYSRIIHVYETDKDGVMHFSNYFRIAEEALYYGLRKLNFSFETTEYSMAMINACATYTHPIKFAEQIRIVIADIKVSRVKILFAMNFLNADQTCLANIQLTFVLIEPGNRKAIPVPEKLRSSLVQI